MFSDALPEDKELRQQLQRRRLVRGGGREGGREEERERDEIFHANHLPTPTQSFIQIASHVHVAILEEDND